MNQTIYLDYNATTPLDPAVVEAMTAALWDDFGNPSSSHAYGYAARDAVERGRRQVAGLLGCAADEVVFTGGGSESDNQALKGIAEAYADRGDHIITSQVEHPAVLNTCRWLERAGIHVTYLPVDETGQVDPDAVARAITPRTILISVMHAQNEVGTLQPIRAIGEIARARGVLLHTDAAQSVGKIPVRVDDLHVDLLTVAGHKLYGPKGIGALYVRRGVNLPPFVHGAGHEGGRRAGTENVPGIVGLGVACELASESMAETAEQVRELRDRLEAAFHSTAGPLQVNGHPVERLPNTLNVCFSGLDGESLLAEVPEIAASTGSACHSGQTEPSSVLLAMGVPPNVAIGAVRLSLGKWTMEDDVVAAAELLARAATRLRRGTSQFSRAA